VRRRVRLALLRGAPVVVVLLLCAPQIAAGARPPRLAVPSAVLVDARDGHVLYSRNATERRPIASTTKLMTALLTLEHLALGRRVAAAPYVAGPGESRIDLRPGERLTVADLLRALLLESANDAAVTLARAEAGSTRRYVREMNERARELGLDRTHYANPVGLDEKGNYSTAADLATLARRLLGNDAFATTVDLPAARLESGARSRVVTNRNDLVARVPWIDGVKTGHTSRAGYVLIGSGTRKGVRLVSVVLGEPSVARRDADTLALLEYGFSRYRRLRVTRRGQPVAIARVSFYGGRVVGLVARSGARLTVRRGVRVRTELEVPRELEGDLRRGARVGELRVFRGGRLVRVIPVVTAQAVPAPGWGRRLARHLAWPALAIALAAFAAAAAGRRRRAKS
jgi:D-alanyl-D-alanine carboxypeptidase (penicillin-binding protein 5/6)